MNKVLLSSVLGLALLTGCGQNEEPTNVVAPADSSSAAPAVESTPAAEAAEAAAPAAEAAAPAAEAAAPAAVESTETKSESKTEVKTEVKAD